MPIYEYECIECQHEMEALQSMSAPALTHCPACDTDSLRKKISAAGFRLKGGGWYETDFKSDGKKNLAGNDSSDKEGSNDKSAKPAASADSSRKNSSSSQTKSDSKTSTTISNSSSTTKK